MYACVCGRVYRCVCVHEYEIMCPCVCACMCLCVRTHVMACLFVLSICVSASLDAAVAWMEEINHMKTAVGAGSAADPIPGYPFVVDPHPGLRLPADRVGMLVTSVIEKATSTSVSASQVVFPRRCLCVWSPSGSRFASGARSFDVFCLAGHSHVSGIGAVRKVTARTVTGYL